MLCMTLYSYLTPGGERQLHLLRLLLRCRCFARPFFLTAQLLHSAAASGSNDTAVIYEWLSRVSGDRDNDGISYRPLRGRFDEGPSKGPAVS